jgi:ribosomal protein L11 methyltransferase
MQWIEAKVIFEHPDIDLVGDLICEIFYEFGLQGVVVEDPDMETEEDWAEDAIARPAHFAVTGYFYKDQHTNERCNTLEEKLIRLKRELGGFFRICYKKLDEQDWANAWKAYFGPQKIGSRIVVKPTWRDYRTAADEIVIELDPGMAFGTGTHPTTALCLNMIEKYHGQEDSFLDVGTGSGILMIAAAKFGAARISGIDKDEVAIEVAARNLLLNGIHPSMWRLTTGSQLADIKETFSFIAANIFSDVILDLLPDISRLSADQGLLICSGIFAENTKAVTRAMEHTGFEILETAAKEDWVALVGRRQYRGARRAKRVAGSRKQRAAGTGPSAKSRESRAKIQQPQDRGRTNQGV